MREGEGETTLKSIARPPSTSKPSLSPCPQRDRPSPPRVPTSPLSCTPSWGSPQPSPLAASLGRGAAGAEGTAGSQGNGAVFIASSKSLRSPSDTDNPRAGGAGLNLSCASAKPTPARRQTPANTAPGSLREPGTDLAPAMGGIWGRNPQTRGGSRQRSRSQHSRFAAGSGTSAPTGPTGIPGVGMSKAERGANPAPVPQAKLQLNL